MSSITISRVNLKTTFTESAELLVERRRANLSGSMNRLNQRLSRFSFITTKSAKHAPALVKLLEQAKQHVPPELVQLSQNAPYGGGGGQGSKSVNFFLERSGAVERFLKKQVERSGAMERSP